MSGLKLFVWDEFAPSYQDGLAFSIAHSETEAKELIILNRGSEPYHWGMCKIYNIDVPIGRSVSGETNEPC